MQLKLYSFLLCIFIAFASSVFGKEDKIGWVVSFDDSTPDSIVTQTMDAFRKLGANVEHQFDIIKGFVLKASESAVNEFLDLDFYATIESEWKPKIEKDGEVRAVGGDGIGI